VEKENGIGDWLRGMDIKEWNNGMGRGQGMVSALWVMQGLPGRGGKLAAASRRERLRYFGCCVSLCLSQELAE
jgi:hypothetical protein